MPTIYAGRLYLRYQLNTANLLVYSPDYVAEADRFKANHLAVLHHQRIVIADFSNSKECLGEVHGRKTVFALPSDDELLKFLRSWDPNSKISDWFKKVDNSYEIEPAERRRIGNVVQNIIKSVK